MIFAEAQILWTEYTLNLLLGHGKIWVQTDNFPDCTTASWEDALDLRSS